MGTGLSETAIDCSRRTRGSNCFPVQDSDREVTAEEGQNFAKSHGCLFVETSAKADVAVTQAFEELVLKVTTASRVQSLPIL